MKIKIEKTVIEEVEIERPLYFKNQYGILLAIYSETKSASVQQGLINATNDNHYIVERYLSEYIPYNEIRKEDFDAEYKRVLDELNSFEL